MSNTKLVILCKPDRLSAKIQHFFAKDLDGKRCDEYPYHGGFVVMNSKYGEPMMYDMNVKSRRIPWSHYSKRTHYLFDLPVEVPEEFLDGLSGKLTYGALDVALYPILQAMQFNFFGTHCTEFCNDVLWWHSIRTPFFPLDAPPSPCAMLKWAMSNL